ncbi:hypothetical protein [Nonomuraea basaltis]|uniref:hypothetical protein n=1 Tax=Nonomuraea basaltis TaxID=2495887 RepID=UPI00110C4C1E|nr:hypothetical protein [Nonomuraea basaltis]TMS00161.1 hypothetical protein EJK15_03560 [Nonomuraea basaltis]
MTLRVSNAARSAAADAVRLLIDAGAGAGKIRVYNGSQPAGPDTALSGQTLLAEFTLADPSFGAASNGVTTLLGTPRTTTGVAAGTASWFRALDSNNVAILDGAVSTSSAELNLNTTTISIGVNVEITAGTITMPA